MKRIKNLLIILFLCSLFIFSFVACAENEQNSDKLIILGDMVFTERSDGTYSVDAANKDISGDLVIPSTYNGKSVTALVKASKSNGAFWGCSQITSVTIPSSITFITGYAFGQCNGVTRVTVESGNPNYYSSGNCIIEKATGTVVCGFKNSVIPDDGSITTIGDKAFRSIDITDITIPDGVTLIDSQAFSSCRSLASVIIPKSVTEIKQMAFSSCDALTVYYKGTKDEWIAISKNSNAFSSSVDIVYIDSD